MGKKLTSGMSHILIDLDLLLHNTACRQSIMLQLGILHDQVNSLGLL